MSEVFISYSWLDRDYALKLAYELVRRGFEVWDKEWDIPAAESRRETAQHIGPSAAVIWLVSPHARESSTVRAEIERARELGKPILSLVIEGKLDGAPGREIQIDVRGGVLPPDWFYIELAQIVQDDAFSLEASGPTASSNDPWRGSGPPKTTASGPVLMSAYHPRQVVPKAWQPLLAYVFRASAAAAVIQDAQAVLGQSWADFVPSMGQANQEIEEGAHITATPRLPGFQFKPLSLTIGFYESWERLDFQLRAFDAPLNQFALGSVTFGVEGIIVADVPLSVFVGESVSAPEAVNETVEPYDKVFCSYSHKDEQIVEHVEAAYQALGMDYLRDVYALKSGQDWDARLLELIDEADIFQLFWSPTAAQSKYVRKEWLHALDLGHKPRNFIRPVYWDKPMPDPPAELAHIHFAYEPRLAR